MNYTELDPISAAVDAHYDDMLSNERFTLSDVNHELNQIYAEAFDERYKAAAARGNREGLKYMAAATAIALGVIGGIGAGASLSGAYDSPEIATNTDSAPVPQFTAEQLENYAKQQGLVTSTQRVGESVTVNTDR